MSLPPKYALYGKINQKECEAEVEKSFAKLRWEKHADTPVPATVEERYFEVSEKTFDFTKFKSTDLPFNSRIILPRALDEESEISMQQLKNKLNRCTQEYTENNRIRINLSEEQEMGLKSIIQRSHAQEIIVHETDKTKRFSCDSADNYRQLAEAHINHDEIVTEETKNRFERLINSHTTIWLRILNAGKDENHKDRIKSSMMSKNGPAAPIAFPRKDHKIYDSEIIGPPGRPLCGGDVSYNKRLSHLASIMLAEIYKDEETVCSSTEDLVSEVDRVNRQGIDGSYIIGSADVEALYPNLDIDFTIDRVCEVFTSSEIKYKSINYKEISLYIALNKTQDEIDMMDIGHLCPRRKYRMGPRPNTTGCGVTIDDEERYRPWDFPDLSRIGEIDEKKLMTEAIRILLHVIMETHTYVFDGTTRRQTKGGPIGMEITGVIAQIFMVWWDRKVKEICRNKRIDIILYERYVDDINIVIKKSEPEVRFDGEDLIHTNEAEIEDELKPSDELTMGVFKTLAESIHNSIKLKVDYPSNHEDGKIPILDLKMWIQETESGNKIMYEHYEKDIASKAVINIGSAMNMKARRTIFTQEILRILTHCSRYLQWEDVCEHINRYMKKLQYSGYKQKFRYHVVDSAIKAFETIKKKADNGERPINRPKHWKRQERRAALVEKKTKWYKQGGFHSVLFVPPTPGSLLKIQYQTEIEKSGLKIKAIEKCGTKLKTLLQKTNPFKAKNCEKDDCFTCRSGGNGDCEKESINYNIICGNNNCNIRNVYNGESSYNGYTRGKEHQSNLRGRNRNSPLWRHCVEIHEEVVQPFTMNITKSFKDDAMMRQIMEAININHTPAENIMNTRTEWNMPRVPHARIT